MPTTCRLTTEDILLLNLTPQQTLGLTNVMSWELADPKDWKLIIEVANSIMEMHGIEPLIVNNKAIASYVNTGESYRATVLYDHAKQVFVVTSWGQFLEQWQAANLIEVSVERVADDIHVISHADWVSWEERTDGPVEDYDSIEEWLDSASMDIRLRVTDHNGYDVLFGSPDYDTDHRGAWGSSSVGKCQALEDCRTIARDLIGQAADNIHLTKTITIIED